jgi:hypothetical protein
MVDAVKRLSKIPALGIAFLFIVAVWCSGLVARSLSFASAPGCSSTGSAPQNAECEHPGFICVAHSSFALVTNSALNSIRIHDLSKNGQLPSIEFAPVDLSLRISLSGNGPSAASLSCFTQKVPIHLFNSVLTL